MRILLIEQDKREASYLKKGLRAESFAVDLAEVFDTGRLLIEQVNYDLVILDLTRRDYAGLGLLSQIQAQKVSHPPLLAIVNKRVQDRIKALDLGADDSISKPFAFGEFRSRVHALLRRRHSPKEHALLVEDLELDWASFTAKRGNHRIRLTQKEFSLLLYLMQNAARPVTRAMIIEHVWDLGFDPFSNVVDVFVNYLRRKIDAPFQRKLIHTIRGIGYQLAGEV